MASTTFFRRRFLNLRRHGGGAYVLADIHPETFADDDGMGNYVYAALTIADCSRHVRLSFEMDTPAEARNALHKARALRQVVNDFVDALEQVAAGDD